MHDETLVWQIGQRLVTGFAGTSLDDSFKEVVKRWKIGNVILFSRNLKDREQITALCAQADELVFHETETHPWIMIDQEGGMVSRLPIGSAIAPGAMALAALGDEQAVYTCAFETAKELRQLGINVNLAPDLDVNSNRENPVIGIRSYGDDPNEVVRFSRQAIKGYLEGGVLCCGKHFPGHGDTSIDSHLALPKVDKTKEQLQGQLLPFRKAIEAGVPSIMSSHVLFPAWEPEAYPCTMSRRIITDLLRKEMGFNGLVFSDCMEMQAIAKYFGTIQGTVRALLAGIDQVMISHHAELAAEAAQQIARIYGDGLFDEAEWQASLSRIADAKAKVFTKKTAPMSLDAVQTFDMYAKQAITTVSGTLPKLSASPVFVGPEGFITSNAQDKLAVDDYPHSLAKRCGGEAIVIPADPTEEDIAMVRSRVNGRQVFLGTYNAHLYRGQLALAYALIEQGIPVVVTCLRNPYDLEKGIREKAACTLAAWEYSQRVFKALAEIYQGEGTQGRMPVTLE